MGRRRREIVKNLLTYCKWLCVMNYMKEIVYDEF